MMKRRSVVVLLIVTFIFNVACADVMHVDRLESDLQKQLLEIALEEADILNDIFSDEKYLENKICAFLSESDYDALTSYTYENPATAVFFLPNDAFDESSVNITHSLPLSSICFGFMDEVNRVLTDGEFAEFSNRMSVYGSEAIPAFKHMAYVELIYSKDGPQIVVAFCEDENGIVLTKASFIYNPAYIKTYVDDGNATFPYVLSQSWDAYFDEYIYRMR